MRWLWIILVLAMMTMGCTPEPYITSQGELNMSLVFTDKGSNIAISPGKIWFNNVSKSSKPLQGEVTLKNNEPLSTTLVLVPRMADILEEGYERFPLSQVKFAQQVFEVPGQSSVQVPFEVFVTLDGFSDYLFWLSLTEQIPGGGMGIRLELCSKVFINMYRKEE